jgi:uncharacterized protein
MAEDQLPENRGRIPTLDVVRGVAVMGILAMNIVAFAMPIEAYSNPRILSSHSGADTLSWYLSFIFVDGKMRGLFSFLFGASILLVIERADAAGRPSARIHFARMAWLLVFGLIHYYFIWYGDILTGYAAIGFLAWLFHRRTTEQLLGAGIALVIAQCLVFIAVAMAAETAQDAASAPGAGAEALQNWRGFTSDLVFENSQELQQTLALYRGPYWGIVRHQLGDGLTDPMFMLLVFGWETLGYMLLGMAMLKSGFLRGSWSNRSYARVAVLGLALTIPLYALLGWARIEKGFSVASFYALDFAATAPLRPVMVASYAALIILLARRNGLLAQRIAATGRAAFTNYLGTSILMTGLFYGWGFGLFGTFSRTELWLVVLAAWLLMLLWSKPWLDHFCYGPFEWLWRSLARGGLQAMRRTEQSEI